MLGTRVLWHRARATVFRPGSRLAPPSGARVSGAGRRAGCRRSLVLCPVDAAAAEWAWPPASHVIVKDRLSPPPGTEGLGRAGQGRAGRPFFLCSASPGGRCSFMRDRFLWAARVRGESPGARVPALGQAGHRDPDSCAHASSHRGFLQPVSSTPLFNAGGRLAESSPQGARLSFEDETHKPQSCPLSDSSFR